MIRVESITITEFRGIRDLTLDFKGKHLRRLWSKRYGQEWRC